MGDRTYAVDANNFLSDGAAALTVSGYAQYGGADGIIDCGGNQNITVTLPSIAASSSITPQQQRIDAAVVIDVTAIVVSNDPAFGATNVMLAGALQLAIAGTGDVPNNFTPPAVPAIGGNRYEILFSNEQNNVKYEYVKLYVVLGGSNASITFKAFMAILPAMQ
jgi:hypothetical protein